LRAIHWNFMFLFFSESTVEIENLEAKLKMAYGFAYNGNTLLL
jgi:hypothetical protein